MTRIWRIIRAIQTSGIPMTDLSLGILLLLRLCCSSHLTPPPPPPSKDEGWRLRSSRAAIIIVSLSKMDQSPPPLYLLLFSARSDPIPNEFLNATLTITHNFHNYISLFGRFCCFLFRLASARQTHMGWLGPHFKCRAKEDFLISLNSQSNLATT